MSALINIIINILATAIAGLVLMVSQLSGVIHESLTPPPITYSTPTETLATTSPQAQFPIAASSTPPASIPAAKPAAKTVMTATTATKVAAQTPSTAPLTPIKSQEQINADTRASLVNILCTSQQGVHGASGSGVIIDKRGIILTNAHVGQMFLLKDYLLEGNVNCVVRMGSPAEPYYTARLLYLPPQWIADNASQINKSEAAGIGENDYAFLLITGAVGARTLPAQFPAITLASSPPSIADEELLAAYPAGFLGTDLINKSLYQTSALAYVTQLFSFSDNTGNIDLFSIGGSVVSQAGSSGGAVVSLYNGALKGLIATASAGATDTGERDLRAITLNHIDRSLTAEGEQGIIQLLSGDVVKKADDFNANIAPQETAALEAHLPKP